MLPVVMQQPFCPSWDRGRPSRPRMAGRHLAAQPGCSAGAGRVPAALAEAVVPFVVSACPAGVSSARRSRCRSRSAACSQPSQRDCIGRTRPPPTPTMMIAGDSREHRDQDRRGDGRGDPDLVERGDDAQARMSTPAMLRDGLPVREPPSCRRSGTSPPSATAATTTMMTIATKTRGRKAMMSSRRSLTGLGPKTPNANCRAKSRRRSRPPCHDVLASSLAPLQRAPSTPPRSTARSNPTRSSRRPTTPAISFARGGTDDEDDQEQDQLGQEVGHDVHAGGECVLQ